MSSRRVYFNGEFVAEEEARISIFDSALMYGDMVFEMTRSFGQKPYRLREHLDRLYASIDYAEIDLEMSIDDMEEATYAPSSATARPSATTTSRSCTTSPAAPSASTPSWSPRATARS